MLQLSSSEDVVSFDAGDIEDLPPHTLAYEELMRIVTRDVAKLNIKWPAEKQEVQKKSLPVEKNTYHLDHTLLIGDCHLSPRNQFLIASSAWLCD